MPRLFLMRLRDHRTGVTNRHWHSQWHTYKTLIDAIPNCFRMVSRNRTLHPHYGKAKIAPVITSPCKMAASQFQGICLYFRGVHSPGR